MKTLSLSVEKLWRIVNGALRSAIDAHGPVTLENHGSAGKRIAKQIHARLNDNDPQPPPSPRVAPRPPA